MRSIGEGIFVYFNNDKKKYNIVFFNGNRYKLYDDGEMLFEVIDDAAFHIMTQKVETAINLFPDRNLLPTIESITNGFRWLCEFVEDDEFPVASALFESGFSSTIHSVLNEPDLVSPCAYVGDLLRVCYNEYHKSIAEFAMIFDSLALCESGINDQDAVIVAKSFKSYADERMVEFTTQCHVRQGHNHRKTVETVRIDSILELLVFEYCRMQKNNKVIKICPNCERYFIPTHRNDSVFCDAPAPQTPSKTCKQIGPQIRFMEKVRSDPQEHQRYNIRSKFNTAIYRAGITGNTGNISYFESQKDKKMKEFMDNKTKKEARRIEKEIDAEVIEDSSSNS